MSMTSMYDKFSELIRIRAGKHVDEKKYMIVNNRVADPVGVDPDPDPTFKKKNLFLSI